MSIHTIVNDVLNYSFSEVNGRFYCDEQDYEDMSFIELVLLLLDKEDNHFVSRFEFEFNKMILSLYRWDDIKTYIDPKYVDGQITECEWVCLNYDNEQYTHLIFFFSEEEVNEFLEERYQREDYYHQVTNWDDGLYDIDTVSEEEHSILHRYGFTQGLIKAEIAKRFDGVKSGQKLPFERYSALDITMRAIAQLLKDCLSLDEWAITDYYLDKIGEDCLNSNDPREFALEMASDNGHELIALWGNDRNELVKDIILEMLPGKTSNFSEMFDENFLSIDIELETGV